MRKMIWRFVFFCTLFLATNICEVQAQWDCESNVLALHKEVSTRLVGSDVICTGSNVQIEYSIARISQTTYVSIEVEILESTTSKATGIKKVVENICVVPRCSSAAHIKARQQILTFDIPSNLPQGIYYFQIKSSLDGSSIYHIACNTRAFKVVSAPSPPTVVTGPGCDLYFAIGCNGTVRWSDGQTGGSVYFRATTTTSYTATCQTACGTSASSTPITVESRKPVIKGNNVFCAGGSTRLFIADAFNYQTSQWWRDGQKVQNVGEVSYSLDVKEAGTYTVTSQHSDHGCPYTSAEFNVQKSQPSVGNIKGNSEYCAGGSTVLSTEAAGGVGNYKYEWLRNGQKVGEGSSFTVNTPGNYRTRVTDGIGCAAQLPTEVAIRENPKPTATLPMLSSLTGIETQIVKAIASSGTPSYSYNWSAEPNVNINNGNSDAPTFGPFTQNTTIKLRVSDAKGCQSEEVRTAISYVPCIISAGIQSQSFFFCKGSLSLVSTVQNGNDGYTYQWRKDNGNTGGNTATLDATEGGQYSVIITDKKGCKSTSATVSVTKGNPSVQITGKLEFCAGGSTLLKTTTQNAKSPLSYKWQGGSNADSLRVGTAGNYNVEITDAQGCTAISPAVAVTQNALPTANAGMGKRVTCAETYALAGVNTATGGAGGYQHSWSAEPAVPISNATASQPTLGPFKENTSLKLQVTDAKGCVGTTQSTITYIAPDLSVTLTGPVAFCSGKSVLLKTTVEKANLPVKQLVWYNGLQETKRDVNEWTTSQKGDYSVYVEDSKGCQKTSSVLKVVENPTPTVKITGPTFFCYGNSATLTANVQSGTPPFKYQWKQNNANTGSDNANLSTSTEGNYAIGLTDGKGCVAESVAWNLVEKGAELVATVQAQGPTTVYAPETVTLAATLGKEYQYQWRRNGQNIAGATASAYVAEQSGSYAVVVSRGDCSRESAATVVRIDVPLATSNLLAEAIKIYPNPTTQKLQIRFKMAVPKNAVVSLYDLGGRLLQQVPLKEEIEIDLNAYSSGNYWLKIQTEQGRFSTLISKQN